MDRMARRSPAILQQHVHANGDEKTRTTVLQVRRKQANTPGFRALSALLAEAMRGGEELLLRSSRRRRGGSAEAASGAEGANVREVKEDEEKGDGDGACRNRWSALAPKVYPALDARALLRDMWEVQSHTGIRLAAPYAACSVRRIQQRWHESVATALDAQARRSGILGGCVSNKARTLRIP